MTAVRLDEPVRLHPLVFLREGDEVTIGRADIDSYGIFPAEGAELVRRLADGDTPAEAAAWYRQEYGEDIDIEDLVGALVELELVRHDGEDEAAAKPVRFQALGRAVFSPVAWVIYIGLVAWALAAMTRSPDLVPHYRNLFFTDIYTLIQVGLFAAAVPLVMLHETYHALAGRRLGVRSRLRVSRRLYFIVMETSLDGLVAVPRRARYLPILAGMLVDVIGIAVCTLAADLTRGGDGALSPAGRFLLAVAFAALLRVVWQFFFYLRTDVYVLISTVLGCVDLHETSKRLLANRFWGLLGRTDKLADLSTAHPVDARAARWYSWLIVGGYAASITTFLVAALPVLTRFATGVFTRLTGSDVPTLHFADAVVFVVFAALQAVVLVFLMLRSRAQARSAHRHHHIVS